MRRRILLLITDLEIGGTPTVVRELAIRLNDPPEVIVEVACLAGWGPVAEQLRERGIQVTALGNSISPSPPYSGERGRAEEDVPDARPLTLTPSPEYGGEGISAFPIIIARLISLLRDRQFDTVFSFLIHANAAAAGISALFPNTRFLQSIQTTQPCPRWHWGLQRWVHHGADTVVVPSPSVAKIARRWSGIRPDKILVIPNAVDMQAFAGRNPSNAVRAKALFRVGFIGRLDPIKRLPDLLQAFQGISRDTAHLHIYGDGAERSRIEALIRKGGMSDRATLHGTTHDPVSALATMDVLVLPSLAEGFGLVLIEAMAAGVPVVATDVPGIRDVIENGRTGRLVPARNPAALRAAILEVCKDANLRCRIVFNGRREVERRFTWKLILPQYRRLLRITRQTEKRGYTIARASSAVFPRPAHRDR